MTVDLLKYGLCQLLVFLKLETDMKFDNQFQQNLKAEINKGLL